MTDTEVLMHVAKVHERRLKLAIKPPQPLLSDEELLSVGEGLARAVEKAVARWQSNGRPQEWWNDVARLLVEKLRLRNSCKYFALGRVDERRPAVVAHIALMETYLEYFSRKHPA